MGTVGIVAALHEATFHSFNITIGALALVFPCIAFAWDGLVRRQALVHAFPIGATLGQRAALITRFKALAVGIIAGLFGIFLLLLAWGTWLVAATQLCRHDTSFVCMRTLLGSAEWPAWFCFGLCAMWFGFVWLRLGDPHKKVLVYGAWYQQETVARAINQQLGVEGVAPLPREQLYPLEDGVVGEMRTRGWLARGPSWFDGVRPRASGVVPSGGTMVAEVLHDPVYRDLGESERAAVGLLIIYFLEQSQRAERMSPLRRWWVGTAQIGKGSVYGRRAL